MTAAGAAVYCSGINDLTPLARSDEPGILADSGVFGNGEDLSPLENLTSLTELQLAGSFNKVDLAPLSSLTNLKSLELQRIGNVASGLAAEDLSCLSGMTKLQSLRLDMGQLNSLSGMETPDGAEGVLPLRQSELYRPEPLGGLTKLQQLQISPTAITRRRAWRTSPPLANLTQLQSPLPLYRRLCERPHRLFQAHRPPVSLHAGKRPCQLPRDREPDRAPGAELLRQ